MLKEGPNLLQNQLQDLPEISKKYSIEERAKFDEILDANGKKNIELAKILYSRLSPLEKSQIKLYTKDLDTYIKGIKDVKVKAEAIIAKAEEEKKAKLEDINTQIRECDKTIVQMKKDKDQIKKEQRKDVAKLGSEVRKGALSRFFRR